MIIIMFLTISRSARIEAGLSSLLGMYMSWKPTHFESPFTTVLNPYSAGKRNDFCI